MTYTCFHVSLQFFNPWRSRAVDWRQIFHDGTAAPHSMTLHVRKSQGLLPSLLRMHSVLLLFIFSSDLPWSGILRVFSAVFLAVSLQSSPLWKADSRSPRPGGSDNSQVA